MAISKTNEDDLESWLEGLGSLREKLLQQGLKTKEELLWLSQEDIDKMCKDNGVPLFEKKRLEMKLLALQALSKTNSRTPSPNGSASHRSSKQHRSSSHAHRHKRNDSNFSNYSTKGGDDMMTDDGYGRITSNRQPTIVRIVFSEAEEAKLNDLDDKLINIKDKIDQIMHNMSSLNWEKDRLEKKVNKHFDEFVIQLQRRREDIKSELNDICGRQMSTMKKYIQSLNKQTKQIRDTQKKCEKYLSNTSLSKTKRKSKVLQVADKALNNKTDEKIIVPEIVNVKKNKKNKKKKDERMYFVSMELDEMEIKRYLQSIGEMRRVLVPYAPKFEIFTIESSRIKLKVWDQQNSSNVFGKNEKTEFMAKIAEQIPRRDSMEDIDEFDQMPSNIPDEHDKGIVEEGNVDNGENAPDQIEMDEKKDPAQNNDEDEDVNHDNEEYKYNQGSNHRKSSKAHRRESRKYKKDNYKRKHRKVDWDQYPVFKPHDANNHKVMSNKYTIWIENLKSNTTYLLKLRATNKYGHGDWTKVYSFVTKLTSFEFKSSVIKEAPMKNAVFEMLCKKLSFGSVSRSGVNDPHQFVLKRIFCTETQGFSAKKFHEICDNKAKTLIIAESEHGNIFGGYTSVHWVPSKSGKFQADANAFLFLLRNGKKDMVQTFNCIDAENATRSDIKSGPCFGAGFDLMFCDSCNKIANSYSAPKSYNIPQNVLIGGKKNFRVKNYDVYIVV